VQAGALEEIVNSRASDTVVRILVGFITVLSFIAILSAVLAHGVVSREVAGFLILAFIVIGLPLARFLGRIAVALLGLDRSSSSSPPDEALRRRRLRKLKKWTLIYVVCLPLAIVDGILQHMWIASVAVGIIGLSLIYVSVQGMRHPRNRAG
jgi:hypothetical protein